MRSFIVSPPSLKRPAGSGGSSRLSQLLSADAIPGKSTEQHYFDWMEGRTAGGAASMHIDPRLPNGGGALNGSTFAMCAKFT